MPKNHFTDTPNLDSNELKFGTHSHASKTRAPGLLKEVNNKEAMAWTKPSAEGSDTSGEHHGAFNLLQADKFICFYADPFDVKNRSALKAKLTFKSMEDGKFEITFPT